tara:strand:- start:103 stop:957 length:855 start_codon:yes stop_codon:yes gene_type:complete
MRTTSVPSPITDAEFHQLSEFFKKDQQENPKDHNLVIMDHHQIPGDVSQDYIPLTPEESKFLDTYKTFRDSNSYDILGCEYWIGIVTEPEFKDNVPKLDSEAMIEEWDNWAKGVREKENLLESQAKSPQIGGEYLVPRQDVHWGVGSWQKRLEDGSARLFLDGDWHHAFVDTYPPWEDLAEARSQKIALFCGSVILPEKRDPSVRLGPNKIFNILDAENKMVVKAVVTHNGLNYHTARCDKGAIYIDLRFTSHLPAIGGETTMIVRLKEADRACPFACVKVLLY